ncbi:hypothetical protein NQ176_g6281 [Zarea fungicola]|uniref:Uncharacterized protein n=1 Tax=Zarea fungicola TaxID=93591 RepID=A0ACC1N5D4_9HYPO|nr:hypothetical protein NQ176_g6281 [Lecanicillium fungicola]
MSQYVKFHKWSNLRGAGDERPTAEQIVRDYGKEGGLGGRVIVLTGVSGGIGAATATALAKTGATVFCAGRDVEKMKAAVPSIVALPTIHFLALDLSSMASVRAFAKDVLARTETINCLINNAGGIRVERSETVDGFEWTLAVNYLGHFLLFNLLKERLLASATAECPSRVVNVASMGHRHTGIVWDNLQFSGDSYNASLAYGQAKTAEIYMATEIERRWGAQHLHAWSLQPGGVMTSNFFKDSGWSKSRIDSMEKNWPSEMFKSKEQGAATTVWAAISDDVLAAGVRGRYLEDVAVAKPMEDTERPNLQGFAAHAYNEPLERKLWTVTESLLEGHLQEN